MALRCQLDPNMTPTWPSLGPPEGPSDLYFTMVFEYFMLRAFIVLRSLMSPHGAQLGPNMGPKRAPKSTKIDVLDWPGVSLFRLRCWKALEDRFGSDLGALLGPFGAHLGRLWGQLGAILGHLGPSWGHLGAILVPSWAILGPSSASLGHLGRFGSHLGRLWGQLGAILGHLGAILGHLRAI